MNQAQQFTRTSSAPELQDTEFEVLSKLIYQLAGIQIPQQKRILITSRLGKRLYALQLDSWADYIKLLKTNNSAEISHFINALTTNKSEFFREKAHFDYIQNEFLPQRLARDQSTIYVWDGACSNGQEVYTTIMTFENYKQQKSVNFRYNILATDIDTDVLATARSGLYRQAEIERYVPKHLISRYFTAVAATEQTQYRFDRRLAEVIKFRQLNLCDAAQQLPIKFDIILIRNVLIYFDKPTIKEVIKKACHHLREDGVIIVGHCESIPAAELGLVSTRQAVYSRRQV